MVEYEPIEQYTEPYQVKPLFNKPQNETEFLQELFNFEKDIDTLVHVWNGDDKNQYGDWIINANQTKQIMNEQGIHWCKSKMKTFACKYYVVTSFDKDEINKMMIIHSKDINHELSKRHVEFGFKDKLDIQSVWSNMISSILAIFKGTNADKQRELLGSTNTKSVVEHKDTSPRQGWFGGNKTQ